MKITFRDIKEQIIPAFKGGDKEYCVKMFDDKVNKIMSGKLIPGASIGLHKHDTNCEIIFITKGTGKVIYDDKQELVETGDCHYCPKGHTHSLINDSDNDLEFYAIVAQQ